MGINLLDKRIILLLIILLFANVVFALDETTLPTGELSKEDLILKNAQDNVLATSNLSIELNQMAITNKENLELVVGLLLQNQNEARTTLIITIIIVTLASQGLWWAIFLYFQTKGMLPSLKKKQPKPIPAIKELNLQQVLE